jgi:hypothetical protein
MKTFLTQTTLARRLGIAPATFASRIRAHRIEPHAIVITGSKPGLLFDAEQMPALRKAFAGEKEVVA